MGYRFNPTPSHYMLVDHLSIQSPGCLQLKPLCYVQLCSIISNFVVHCTVVLCRLHWIDERMLLYKVGISTCYSYNVCVPIQNYNITYRRVSVW